MLEMIALGVLAVAMMLSIRCIRSLEQRLEFQKIIIHDTIDKKK